MEALKVGRVGRANHLPRKWEGWTLEPVPLEHCTKLCHKQGWGQGCASDAGRESESESSVGLKASGEQGLGWRLHWGCFCQFDAN